MSLYLGLDSSTQGLTATLIEVDGPHRRIVLTRALRYDEDLPAYGTRHGVLPSADPAVVHAPPLMWAEALERIMASLAREPGIDWRQLRAVSGSGQQHGSVYLNARARARLEALSPDRPLTAQLEDVLSRKTAPIWMDSSTTPQCAAIEQALGGPAGVARLTGSRAYERFTGPQIRKFAEEDPGGYSATERIHLVSSWMASLLAGRHAAIDHGDGSGMNLMDLARKEWAQTALEATAPALASRLPALAPSWTIVGPLAPFWCRRFGLPPARVVAWSGDNPCSMVGTGLIREGLVAISLGTSDTIFGPMRSARPSDDGTGHVFASPTGTYMGMTVFKNGSLARERVRDEHGLDWSGFGDALRRTPAGNGGAMMLPWFDPEITPLVLAPGVRRFDLDPRDAPANVRAVVEAQMLAMVRHSRWMNVGIQSIYATGGAATNRDVLQVMADVFDAAVYQFAAANSAALGAALRALHADALASRTPMSWEEVVAGFAEPVADSRVSPIREHVERYRPLLELYAQRERQAVQSPTPANP
ncbi:MAG TPA: FGGY family carbohydrate kinase [Vicinamibacterales bacterium]|nr:FGGY family carbohydrate kinase [Vicinamibacterales bacterium]